MELHDNIGQILTSLKINLEVIQGQLSPDHPEFESRIRASREKTVQALTDIKNISRGLSPLSWILSSDIVPRELLMRLRGIQV